MINEKVPSNPELVELNILVGEALDRLLDRKWGTVTMIVSCQNGRIKTLKVIDDQIYVLKNSD